jgi:hypothetical protein
MMRVNIRYVLCLLCFASVLAARAEEPAPAGTADAKTGTDSAEAQPAKAFDTAAPGATSPRERALTIHPAFSIAISGLNLSLEMPLGNGLWSYEIPLYLGYRELRDENAMFFAGSGFTLRRYLNERGSGAYFAPSLDFVNVHRFEGGPLIGNNLLFVAPNLRMGYRWTWRTFTLDASTGFFYYENILTQGRRDVDDWEIRGLLPMTQLAVGVPF